MKFEKALASLETVVAQLEAGDLGLDESLKVFEKGVKLTRECQQQLQTAEQKVAVLLAEQQDKADLQGNKPAEPGQADAEDVLD